MSLYRVPLAQQEYLAVRVGGKTHGRRKRPLDTANQAVKDTLSVPILSRSFSGYSYGLQHL